MLRRTNNICKINVITPLLRPNSSSFFSIFIFSSPLSALFGLAAVRWNKWPCLEQVQRSGRCQSARWAQKSITVGHRVSRDYNNGPLYFLSDSQTLKWLQSSSGTFPVHFTLSRAASLFFSIVITLRATATTLRGLLCSRKLVFKKAFLITNYISVIFVRSFKPRPFVKKQPKLMRLYSYSIYSEI